jgi:hypothetical protein
VGPLTPLTSRDWPGPEWALDSPDREGGVEAGQGPVQQVGPLTPLAEKEGLRLARALGNKWDPRLPWQRRKNRGWSGPEWALDSPDREGGVEAGQGPDGLLTHLTEKEGLRLARARGMRSGR